MKLAAMHRFGVFVPWEIDRGNTVDQGLHIVIAPLLITPVRGHTTISGFIPSIGYSFGYDYNISVRETPTV